MSDAAPTISSPGALSGDPASGEDICRHCQVKIVHVRYKSGARWMHTRGFDLYEHCRTTTAGPGNPTHPAVLTGQVPVSGNQE